MKRTTNLQTIYLALGLFLASALAPGCGPATPAPLPAAAATGGSGVELGDPACKYTQQSNAHVQPRHCDPNQYKDKSKFNDTTQACNGVAGGQSFCTTVQSSYDKRTVQPDGRICYDKSFSQPIGAQMGVPDSWARVVIDPSGEVVTLFPESRAGCK